MYTDALADYNKAISIDPKNGSAYFNRGDTEKAMGNLANAKADFKMAFQLSPRLPQLFLTTGIARCKSGSYTHALNCFIHAIDINPQFADAYNARGYVYYKLGGKANCKKAVADYDAAKKMGGASFKPVFEYRADAVKQN